MERNAVDVTIDAADALDATAAEPPTSRQISAQARVTDVRRTQARLTPGVCHPEVLEHDRGNVGDPPLLGLRVG